MAGRDMIILRLGLMDNNGTRHGMTGRDVARRDLTRHDKGNTKERRR